MNANGQAEQESEYTAVYHTRNSAEFQAFTGIVESEDGNIIALQEGLHDVTEAMIIDEEGNIPKEKCSFYGKEVLVLYQHENVISVMIFPPM